MIKQYQTNFTSIAKPRAIGQSYFVTNGDGFTLDYFYGPYDIPDNGMLTFSYTDMSTFDEIHRPTAILDGEPGPNGQGVWQNIEGTALYNTRLDYQKALAKQMLIDANQFFVGKKVAFMESDGKKATEYVVVENENGDLVFEESESNPLEVYEISFDSLQADGAQAPINVASRYFTMPKSAFKNPGKKLFEGWQFGYENSQNQIVLDTDDEGKDIIYDYGEVADLHAICEKYSIKNNRLTFYANYTDVTSVSVEFESGQYVDNEWEQLFGSDDYSGYICVQDGDNPENTKPLDWETEYSSYFTINDEYVEGVNYCSYYKIKPREIWRRVGSDYAGPEYEWTETHFGEWFGNTRGWNEDPEEAYNMLYGISQGMATSPIYVYVPANDETNLLGKELVLARTWYQCCTSSAINRVYKPCGPVYADYKNEDLYTFIIRNGFTMFNNGEPNGTIQYDCVGETTRAYNKVTLQLNSDIREPYNERYQFDHWEVYPQKTVYVTDDYSHIIPVSTNIDGTSYTIPVENAVIKLDSYYTEDDEQYPANRYVIRAVYKKYYDMYAKLYLDTNYTQNGPHGNIKVSCEYRNFRNQLMTRLAATASGNGNPVLESIYDLTEYFFYSSEEGCIMVYPRVVEKIILYTETQSQNTILYCWSDYDDNIISQTYVPNITRLRPNPEIVPTNGQEYKYKAWFVYKNDITATLKVGRRRASPTGVAVASSYNGSIVNIYEPREINTPSYTHSSNSDGGSIVNLEALVDEEHCSAVQYTQANLDNLDQLTAYHYIRPEGNMTFGTSLGTSVTSELGEMYFIAALEATNGLKFLRWNDGVTTNPRLIKLTLPKLYNYIGIFEGEPLAISTTMASHIADYEYQQFTAEHINSSTNSGKMEEMQNMDNMVAITPYNDATVYYNGSVDVESSDYTIIKQIAESHVGNGPEGGATVTYDYNGNQYKSESVIDGVVLR